MKCYCGMDVAEGVFHYPGNDPEVGMAHTPTDQDPSCLECGGPRHDGPCEDVYGYAQCYDCGRMVEDVHGEPGWTTRTVDDDPGDPEVGPQPCIIDVDVCPACSQKGDVRCAR